jgi:hypothetical protein
MVRNTTATLLILVLHLVAACAPAATTPTPTPIPMYVEILATEPEHLEGLWPDRNAQHYVRFDADGTLWFAARPEELGREPGFVAEYWFEEGLYHKAPGPHFEGLGVYKAYLAIREGRAVFLRWELVEDPDLQRRSRNAIALVRAD